MKSQRFFVFLLLIAFSTQAQQHTSFIKSLGRGVSFDDNWRFVKDSTIQAYDRDYDDSKWRTIDLPHDWSIEDLALQTSDSVIGPFDKNSVGNTSTAFTVGGTGWYRKKFTLSPELANREVVIHFDGVYMNSDVWINGHHLGNHPYGYTPFYYDLTSFLNMPGKENVIAVRVRNQGKNSRWYSGSGIYRHVWLSVTDPLHIDPWGIYITTPEISDDKATVEIRTGITNRSANSKNVTLLTDIIAPDGRTVGRQKQNILLDAGASKTPVTNVVLTSPRLWSVDTPQLYKAVTEIREGDKIVGREESHFGIRTIRINTEEGLLVNGKRTLLKGGCIHHDNGPLGAAAIDRAEERKIELLKQNGFNAIRTSHNPPSKQLLDACDRIGILVIDEAFDQWELGKNPEDYHLYFDTSWKKDLDAMVLRDRNHPSVIFWSIGNEINERVDSAGLIIEKKLIDEINRIDSTRPVTEAICFFWDHPGYKWDTTATAFSLLDVGGYNYQFGEYVSDHAKHPKRVIMGTESFPMQALENWNAVEKHPYVIGDFVWTAVDYLGEASIGHSLIGSSKDDRFILGWPWFNAYCGDIDLVGNKKPQSYYRDVIWRNKPLAMAVHVPMADSLVESISYWGWPEEQQSWTWPGVEGRMLQVRVFSRAPLVRLYLNGKLVGERAIADGSITAVFKVAYQPGILKAVNVRGGKETDVFELKTAGASQRIKLVADRTSIHANRNDLSYVTIEIVDDKGEVVPNAEIPVKFSVSGTGQIAATGNGNPIDVASFQKPERKTWRGKALVILRPTGKPGNITLKATADGLTSSEILISVK